LVKDLASNDPNSAVRAAALNYLANNLEGTDAEAIYIDRIEKDQSYLVISAALKNLGKINPDKAIEKAKKLESEKSSKMLAGIGQLYGSYGKKENYSFFELAIKGKILQGFDQLSMMNSLTYFISRQELEMVSQSYELYAYLSTDGGYYTQMFMPQNIEYVNTVLDTKLLEAKEELAAHEKNNDALYADQARKKIKSINELKEKFNALVVEEE